MHFLFEYCNCPLAHFIFDNGMSNILKIMSSNKKKFSIVLAACFLLENESLSQL